jgi:opacity protein-like surface antigen
MRIASFFLSLVLVGGAAQAQTTQQPSWELNVSAGLFQGRPDDQTRGWDDWYNQGRYAASIGRYWTTHLKTEIEFATTGEGRQFTQQFVPVPGTAINYPVSVEVFRKLQQGSARAVWQFNDNAWVHPYLSVGAVYEIERTRQWSPEQFYYPGDPRSVPRVTLSDELDGGTKTDHRAGFSIGGGSKFYFSPSAYINTGIQVTRAKPSTTVTLLAGIGIDF